VQGHIFNCQLLLDYLFCFLYPANVARPLRIDFPDSFYHVLSRGNEKRKIFYDARDYERFLEILGRMAEKFSLEIHAYVLMPNHYHLLLRTRYGNLSRAIQWLGVSYSVWFNRKHDRVGHLFHGRFKSFLAENERYLTALCLYVHGNPVRARLVERPADYRWSSYRAYLQGAHSVPWLTTDLLLSFHGNSRKRTERAHDAYLARGANIFEDLHYGLFLGTKQYAEQCLKKLKIEKHPEKPQTRRVRGDLPTVALRLLTVLGEKEPRNLLESRRRAPRPPRDLAMYLLAHLGTFTHREIGEFFGVGYTAVTEAVKRAASALARDRKLKERMERLLIDF